MARTLATVQIISKLESIKNADKIELASFEDLGWKCVMKKGESTIGSAVVYFEIDSLVPDKPEFEFLRDSKFKIKSRLFRGQLSQGLALPISVVSGLNGVKLTKGLDLTEKLGILNYVKIAEEAEDVCDINTIDKKSNSKVVKFLMQYRVFRKAYSAINKKKKDKGWPSWISKTDETRIQNCTRILEELNGVKCYISVKCDGKSMTTWIEKTSRFNKSIHNFCKKVGINLPEASNLVVAGRNMVFRKDNNSDYWTTANNLSIKDKLMKDNGKYCLQGELCGPKIQANRIGLKEYHYYIFNIFDREEKRFLDYQEFIDTAKRLELETVPIDETIVIDETYTVDKLLEMAKGKYNSGHEREGIVVRPVINKYSDKLRGRTSFKAINNEFLLKIENGRDK